MVVVTFAHQDHVVVGVGSRRRKRQGLVSRPPHPALSRREREGISAHKDFRHAAAGIERGAGDRAAGGTAEVLPAQCVVSKTRAIEVAVGPFNTVAAGGNRVIDARFQRPVLVVVHRARPAAPRGLRKNVGGRELPGGRGAHGLNHVGRVGEGVLPLDRHRIHQHAIGAARGR